MAPWHGFEAASKKTEPEKRLSGSASPEGAHERSFDPAAQGQADRSFDRSRSIVSPTLRGQQRDPSPRGQANSACVRNIRSHDATRAACGQGSRARPSCRSNTETGTSAVACLILADETFDGRKLNRINLRRARLSRDIGRDAGLPRCAATPKKGCDAGLQQLLHSHRASGHRPADG